MQDPIMISQEQYNQLIRLLTRIYGRPPSLDEGAAVLLAIGGCNKEAEAERSVSDTSMAKTLVYDYDRWVTFHGVADGRLPLFRTKDGLIYTEMQDKIFYPLLYDGDHVNCEQGGKFDHGRCLDRGFSIGKQAHDIEKSVVRWSDVRHQLPATEQVARLKAKHKELRDDVHGLKGIKSRVNSLEQQVKELTAALEASTEAYKALEALVLDAETAEADTQCQS